MKMKNLIWVVVALIVAGIVFGTIMFFVRRSLKEAGGGPVESSEDSARTEEEIDKIPVEYILLQINTDPEKSYTCTGFLFDKRGNRHYFDLTGHADLSAEEIYSEAVKQSEYYEPEEYIYKGDIPLLYSQISSIDPDNSPEIIENNSLANTRVFYAILSDGVKTYPVAIYGEGQKTVSTSDSGSQSLGVYLKNLLQSRGNDSTYAPVTTDKFKIGNSEGSKDEKDQRSKESSEEDKKTSEEASAESE